VQANDIRVQLVTAGIAAATDLQGCTRSEIEDLERLVGAQLPAAYEQFLLAIGHRAGAFLQGTDVSYAQVVGLADAARALLTENGLPDALPKDAFVFYMHQGYEFGYFPPGAGEDPPVFPYVEGQGGPQLVWPRFTAYLADMMRFHGQAIKRRSRG
jgi:hypothetical protein